ncbi:MAG TPA: efflux RND transporter periplasmic adaptor subunit [Cytophagaceae bacterium]|jgi:membrane fusion protein (multidrug efflux system)|nr:efflux RND transporter periplasmic adaptor subunit [Cytophagaceae bacterium]
MKKTKPYFIVAIIFVALVFIKAKFFTPEKAKAAIADKEKKKPATTVSVFVVGNTNLEDKIFANGTILANEEAELKPEVNGRVTFLYLPEGKQVTKGTLLLKLNDAEIKAQLEKIKVQLALASETEQRLKNLYQVNGISKQEYEVALSQLQSLKADSVYYQAQIAKTELYAPFDGVLGVRTISVGSYVTPAETIASIRQVNPVKIEFSLPEKYADLFRIGDRISFKKEGLSDTLNGIISVKDPFIEINSRSVRYRALSENRRGLLLPGAFVRVELLVKDEANTVFIPTEAIVPVAMGKKAYIVKNNKAEGRMIETGIRTEDYVQVFSGLQPGDSVVVNGNFLLKDGSAVKISKGKKK